MRNLAGDDYASREARLELERAEIEVVLVEPQGEVMSNYGGFIQTQWGNIKLRRAWTYWVAEGIVPLDVASYLYKRPEGKISVRVNGHCGCPNPCECFEQFDLLTLKELQPRSEYDKTIEFFEARKWQEAVENYKSRVLVLEDCRNVLCGIKVYHIDDQAGLLLFSMAMRGLLRIN